jgi:hypothetical protein
MGVIYDDNQQVDYSFGQGEWGIAPRTLGFATWQKVSNFYCTPMA